MEKIISQPNKKINSAFTFAVLIVIVIFAFMLRLYNLAGHDMATDDVLYSFRSIGYIDYIAAVNNQSTPITWFSEPQWWQHLSFHDHPPLVFAIQWFFFKIGGINIWTARIPFVLASTLSVFFIFFLAKMLFNTVAAFFSAIALAIANYAIWISRIGFLEGFLIPWIILSMFFFIKAKKRSVNYLWWFVFLALGTLTKYTFLFMVPIFLLLLLIYRRPALKEKWFYFGIVVFLVLISPVVIYNFMMLQTRGHFDAAFSTIIGQHPEDFRGLVRQTNKNLNIFSATKKVVADNFSGGFQILLVAGLLLFLYKIVKEKENRECYSIILSGSLFAIVSLSLVGGGGNFGVIILPFTTLIIGYLAFWIQNLAGRKRKALLAALILLSAWELLLGIQSQLILKPLINNNLFVSANYLNQFRTDYNQLEIYVDNFHKIFAGQPVANRYLRFPQLAEYQYKIIDALLQKYPELPPYKHLLVYDNRLAWFQSVWIFERRILYEAAPIDTLSQFLETMQNKGADFYARFGFEDVTIITSTENVEQNQIVENKEIIQDFVKQLEATEKPIDEIRGSEDGRAIFKIFRLPLKNLSIK